MTTQLGLLRQRDFALFLLARLASNMGAQMQTVAVGLQVYAKTGNPFDLGMVGLSQFLPFVVLILPAGHWADRYDRRRVLMGCYALHVVCAALLLLFTWTQVAAVQPIFIAMTLLGIARAFGMPASQALLPNLVSKTEFGTAVALNSTVFHMSTIIGPMLGGLLFMLGVHSVYILVMVLALTALCLLAAVRVRTAQTLVPQEPGLRSLLSGLVFVRAQPLILGAISLDLFAVLFGGATALLPIYARDIFHVGATGLGLLRTAPGVGALLCAIGLSLYPIKTYVGRWLFGSIFIFGIATVVFGVTAHFSIALVALVILGASDMLSVFVRNLLLQLHTPDAMRGRVSAVSAVFIGASNELGEFESGITAAWLGTVRAVVVGGVATIGVVAVWIKLFPALARLHTFPESSQ